MSYDVSIFHQEPMDEYKAKSKKFLSSHSLADFRKCPVLYRRKQDGLIPDRDSAAFVLGRAAHTLILEGQDKFMSEYLFSFQGPKNPKTGEVYGSRTKNYQEWATQQTRPIISEREAALCASMAAGVMQNDIATGFLQEGIAEATLRGECLDVPIQVRIDWMNPTAGIIDIKTCDDLTWFEADARRYGYIYQMAFYRELVTHCLGGEVVPVFMIAVEKQEPFRCGVWRASEESLGLAAKENVKAVGRLRECTIENTWPTGYEDVRTFDHI